MSIAELLLSAKVPADVGATDTMGDTPMHVAARGAAREAAERGGDDDDDEDRGEGEGEGHEEK